MLAAAVVLVVLVVIAIVLLAASVRIVQAYERALVIRFGRITGIRSGGITMIVPFVEHLERFRTVAEPVGLDPQQVVTRDSVTIDIEAVLYYRVSDPAKCWVSIDTGRIEDAIAQLGQSIMRRVVGQHPLEEILSHSDAVSNAIRQSLDRSAHEWGIEITMIELKDVTLPESMQRAMAAKAEAEREADAKVIAARGELDASLKLQEAADSLDARGMKLRELQTWREIGAENSAIIIVAGSDADTSLATAAASAAGQLAGAKIASM